MFSEEERLIYRYHDGRREVRADPLALHRRLVQAAGGDLAGLARRAGPPEERDLPPAGTPEADAARAGAVLAAYEAQERLLAVVRVAFGLPDYDPESNQGATDATAFRVWNDWAEWQEKNATRAGGTPTSPASSACPGFSSTT